MKRIKSKKQNKKNKKKTFIITNDVDLVIKKIQEKINSSKKDISFALPGGRSVKVLFDGLKKANINWKKVHIFLVDERIVPLHHEDSNFNMLKKELLDYLIKNKGLLEKKLHPFDIEKHDIKSYSEEIKIFNGFDIAVFGVGEDCHIGALFPNYSINHKGDYYIEIDNSPKLPKHRMTSSKKLVKKTKLGIFLFIGESKKEAYKKFLDKKTKLEDCPAKLAYSINSIVLQTD